MCATPAELLETNLFCYNSTRQIGFFFVYLLVVCLDFFLFYYGKGAGQSSKSTNLFGGEKPLMRAAACEGR